MMDVKLGRGNLFEKGPPPLPSPTPPTSKSFVFIESLFVNVRSALYGAFCFSVNKKGEGFSLEKLSPSSYGYRGKADPLYLRPRATIPMRAYARRAAAKSEACIPGTGASSTTSNPRTSRPDSVRSAMSSD